MTSNHLKNIGILINIFPFHRIEADLYQKPEDFIVEEIFPKFRCTIEKKIEKIPNFSGKRYIEATLVKKNMSTFDACKIIAKENNLHFNDISYCGLKDTFGITAQRVCILNKGKLKRIKFKNAFLKDFRGTNKKLNLREHLGNHFIVKARNISVSSGECRKLLQIFKERIERGLPNFYYFQRFGKRQHNHILGKLILKKKYKEFIFRFLTETSKNERKEITLIRKKIKANFNNLFICLRLVQKYPELTEEKELIENILSKGKEWAVKNMKLSRFFLNSLSSYLFNLALSTYLKKIRGKIENIKLEKIGSNTKFDKINQVFYSSIFKKEGIKLSDFKNLPEELKIEGHSRKIFFFPKNFKFQIKKRNAVLEFDLGIGEYASLLLDFIFKNRLPPKLE